jgi:hypothetical protein
MSLPRFVRRIDGGVEACANKPICPQVWELETGDYAVIGKDITDEVRATGAGHDIPVANDERVVVLPRDVMQSSKGNL